MSAAVDAQLSSFEPMPSQHVEFSGLQAMDQFLAGLLAATPPIRFATSAGELAAGNPPLGSEPAVDAATPSAGNSKRSATTAESEPPSKRTRDEDSNGPAIDQDIDQGIDPPQSSDVDTLTTAIVGGDALERDNWEDFANAAPQQSSSAVLLSILRYIQILEEANKTNGARLLIQCCLHGQAAYWKDRGLEVGPPSGSEDNWTRTFVENLVKDHKKYKKALTPNFVDRHFKRALKALLVARVDNIQPTPGRQVIILVKKAALALFHNDMKMEPSMLSKLLTDIRSINTKYLESQAELTNALRGLDTCNKVRQRSKAKWGERELRALESSIPRLSKGQRR